MNRHLARTLAMQTLYESQFQPNQSAISLLERNVHATNHGDGWTFSRQLVEGTKTHTTAIDDLIAKAAPEWPLDQVAVVDKSILRLAIYELLYSPDVPAKVVINEAVELAKTFGGVNSSKFVNGVLGTIYRQSDRGQSESDSHADEV